MFQIATMSQHGLHTNLFVVFLTEKFVKKRQKTFSGFPAEIIEYLENYFKYRDFKGSYKEKALLYPGKQSKIDRILLLGLGDETKLNDESFRELGYQIASVQSEISEKRIHIFLGNMNFCRENLIRSISEGIQFKNYSFEEYKSQKKQAGPVGQYVFVCNRAEYTPRFRKALLETEATMKGVKLSRDLANQPSNNLTPKELKNFVTAHFKKYDNVEVEIFDKKELQKRNFNTMLAVAQGSKESPYLIIIKYNPSKKTSKSMAMVGKGVTFDSGGISIKPSASMDEMKYDMAGAAAVIGAMDVAAQIEPKFSLYGIIPAVENMPGGNAIKPGDIIKSYSGKTIEILNTDAEGRLILADALAYTTETIKPGVILDFATLTGSIMAALGDKMAGLFSNSDELAGIFEESAQGSGDRLWRMPLSDIYKKELESTIADTKNLGSRWGGAISAAMFLQQFTGDIPWAHIDMAGTANDVKDIEYLGKGATGYGPRLMVAAWRRLEKFL